jgi:hypothetical protein
MFPGNTVALFANVLELGLVTVKIEPAYGVVSPEGSLINKEAFEFNRCEVVNLIVRGPIR